MSLLDRKMLLFSLAATGGPACWDWKQTCSWPRPGPLNIAHAVHLPLRFSSNTTSTNLEMATSRNGAPQGEAGFEFPPKTTTAWNALQGEAELSFFSPSWVDPASFLSLHAEVISPEEEGTKPLGKFVFRGSNLWKAIESDFQEGNEHCGKTNTDVGTFLAGDGSPYGLFIYSIERVTDPVLEGLYNKMRSDMASSSPALSEDPLAKILKPAAYTEKVAKADAVEEGKEEEEKVEVSKSAGEMFLFHGTNGVAARAIAARGPDITLAGPGLYGNGFYTTDQAIKSIQYCRYGNGGMVTDTDTNIRSPGSMLLMQGLLGRKPFEFEGTMPSPEDLLDENEDKTPNALVVNGAGGETSGKWNDHREIIFFHTVGTLLPKFLVRFIDQAFSAQLAEEELNQLTSKDHLEMKKKEILEKNPAAICSMSDEVEQKGEEALQPTRLWDIIVESVTSDETRHGSPLDYCCVFRTLPVNRLRQVFEKMATRPRKISDATRCFAQRGSIPPSIPRDTVLSALGEETMGSDTAFVEKALGADPLFLARGFALYPKMLAEKPTLWCEENGALLQSILLVAAGKAADAEAEATSSPSVSTWAETAAALGSVDWAHEGELQAVLEHIPQCWHHVARSLDVDVQGIDESHESPSKRKLGALVKAARDRICKTTNTAPTEFSSILEWTQLSRVQKQAIPHVCTHDEQEAAVLQEPQNLAFVSSKVRGDKGTVLQAVKRSGGVLEFAGMELRSDRDVVLAALRNDYRNREDFRRRSTRKLLSLRWASKSLREDPQFMLDALGVLRGKHQEQDLEIRDPNHDLLVEIQDASTDVDLLNLQHLAIALSPLQNDPDFMLGFFQSLERDALKVAAFAQLPPDGLRSDA
ncbi:unnamed protein product, partial [Amoebophrya sp. A25]|eukprot:GSA25T00008537001.1